MHILYSLTFEISLTLSFHRNGYIVSSEDGFLILSLVKRMRFPHFAGQTAIQDTASYSTALFRLKGS